jgi:HlyD family secretion protein
MKDLQLWVVTALCLFLLAGCGNDRGVPEGSGFIEATEVVISAEVTGTLESLDVSQGEMIRAGDAIGLIDTTTLTLRLAEARAYRQAALTQVVAAEIRTDQAALDSSLAGKEFDRVRSLIGPGSVNEQQYDQAETRYRQAGLAAKSARAALKAAGADLKRIEAEMDLVKKQLADCRPLSPLDGTVVETYLEAGELVVTGKPLVKIARLDSVWVKIYLPPHHLTQIKLGDKAEVDPEDGRGELLQGWVSWISPEAEFTPKNVQTKEARADLVYAVKVSIANPDQRLKIGMPVMVRIP